MQFTLVDRSGIAVPDTNSGIPYKRLQSGYGLNGRRQTPVKLTTNRSVKVHLLLIIGLVFE